MRPTVAGPTTHEELSERKGFEVEVKSTAKARKIPLPSAEPSEEFHLSTLLEESSLKVQEGAL